MPLDIRSRSVDVHQTVSGPKVEKEDHSPVVGATSLWDLDPEFSFTTSTIAKPAAGKCGWFSVESSHEPASWCALSDSAVKALRSLSAHTARQPSWAV